jgi:hypothetical protein
VLIVPEFFSKEGETLHQLERRHVCGQRNDSQGGSERGYGQVRPGQVREGAPEDERSGDDQEVEVRDLPESFLRSMCREQAHGPLIRSA